MTSTMKSEPALPAIRDRSLPGVPVSAAIVRSVGGSAEGSRGATLVGAAFAPFCAAVVAVAAPATATPARKLRRLTSGRGFFVPWCSPVNVTRDP